MEYVKNGISGQKRYVVNNNKVFDAKTGRHIYTVDNGVSTVCNYRGYYR